MGKDEEDNIKCNIPSNISIVNEIFESLFVEYELMASFIVGVIYRRPYSDVNVFSALQESVAFC